MASAVVLQFDVCSADFISNQTDSYTSEFINPAFRNAQDNPDETQGCDVSFSQGLKNATLSSIKQLLKMYKLQVDVESSAEHIHPENSTYNPTTHRDFSATNVEEINQDDCETEQKECHFSKLPDALYLEIFSYLSARDLCKISPVCKRWERLSSDNVLWQKKLDLDMYTWHVISHTTNPHMYKECQSDYTSKEVYLRCSPVVNRMVRQQNYGFHQLSTILRSLLPRRVPRVAMFGPGLEMSTSPIVRKIIQDKTGLFKATGMFPGKFDGVGSGFTMRMENGESFNLMALYTSTQHEREAFRQQQQEERQLQANRMLQAQAIDIEEGSAKVYELRPAIRELARTLDAVVFVVDASTNISTIAAGYTELKAMLNELWSQPGVPVLVLSCVSEYNSSRIPCIRITEELQLSSLNRPWQAYDCVVDSLAGVGQAFTWLVQQAQRT